MDECRKGYGTISAAGGKGWGGGGGGRISLDCYSIQEDLKVSVHGLSNSLLYPVVEPMTTHVRYLIFNSVVRMLCWIYEKTIP